jgi:hypothetical protein
LFHTKRHREPEAYNSWNFTSEIEWDEFFFDRSTSRFYKCPYIEIGTTAGESAAVRAHSTKTTSRDKEVESKVLGIPYKMKDKVELELLFEAPLTLDSKGFLKLASKYPGSSDLYVAISWSFA